MNGSSSFEVHFEKLPLGFSLVCYEAATEKPNIRRVRLLVAHDAVIGEGGNRIVLKRDDEVTHAQGPSDGKSKALDFRLKDKAPHFSSDLKNRFSQVPLTLVFQRNPANVLEDRLLPSRRAAQSYEELEWADDGQEAWLPWTFGNKRTVLWPGRVRYIQWGTGMEFDFMDAKGMDYIDTAFVETSTTEEVQSEAQLRRFAENFGVASFLYQFVPVREKKNFEQVVVSILAHMGKGGPEAILSSLDTSARAGLDANGLSASLSNEGESTVARFNVAAQVAAARSLYSALKSDVDALRQRIKKAGGILRGSLSGMQRVRGVGASERNEDSGSKLSSLLNGDEARRRAAGDARETAHELVGEVQGEAAWEPEVKDLVNFNADWTSAKRLQSDMGVVKKKYLDPAGSGEWRYDVMLSTQARLVKGYPASQMTPMASSNYYSTHQRAAAAEALGRIESTASSAAEAKSPRSGQSSPHASPRTLPSSPVLSGGSSGSKRKTSSNKGGEECERGEQFSTSSESAGSGRSAQTPKTVDSKGAFQPQYFSDGSDSSDQDLASGSEENEDALLGSLAFKPRSPRSVKRRDEKRQRVVPSWRKVCSPSKPSLNSERDLGRPAALTVSPPPPSPPHDSYVERISSLSLSSLPTTSLSSETERQMDLDRVTQAGTDCLDISTEREERLDDEGMKHDAATSLSPLKPLDESSHCNSRVATPLVCEGAASSASNIDDRHSEDPSAPLSSLSFTQPSQPSSSGGDSYGESSVGEPAASSSKLPPNTSPPLSETPLLESGVQNESCCGGATDEADLSSLHIDEDPEVGGKRDALGVVQETDAESRAGAGGLLSEDDETAKRRKSDVDTSADESIQLDSEGGRSVNPLDATTAPSTASGSSRNNSAPNSDGTDKTVAEAHASVSAAVEHPRATRPADVMNKPNSKQEKQEGNQQQRMEQAGEDEPKLLSPEKLLKCLQIIVGDTWECFLPGFDIGAIGETETTVSLKDVNRANKKLKLCLKNVRRVINHIAAVTSSSLPAPPPHPEMGIEDSFGLRSKDYVLFHAVAPRFQIERNKVTAELSLLGASTLVSKQKDSSGTGNVAMSDSTVSALAILADLYCSAAELYTNVSSCNTFDSAHAAIEAGFGGAASVEGSYSVSHETGGLAELTMLQLRQQLVSEQAKRGFAATGTSETTVTRALGSTVAVEVMPTFSSTSAASSSSSSFAPPSEEDLPIPEFAAAGVSRELYPFHGLVVGPLHKRGLEMFPHVRRSGGNVSGRRRGDSGVVSGSPVSAQPAFDECPHFAKYRTELLMNAQARFASILQRVGGSGKPLQLTQLQGIELAAKLFVHWYFMDRCRPSVPTSSSALEASGPNASTLFHRDVIAPLDVTTLAEKILVGSKTVRLRDTEGYERSKLWSEEPQEVAAAKTGRNCTGPQWACTCGVRDVYYHRMQCYRCGAPRPKPPPPLHHVWTAARRVTEEWRKHFEVIHGKLLSVSRYLPSTGPGSDWSDATTKVTAELEAKSDEGGLDGRMRLKLDGVNITNVKIRKPVYDRLCAKYLELGHDRFKMQTRLLNMALRYHCIMGESGQHGQLPREVFKFLHEKLGVTHECFASPLNWQTAGYCSAFKDCDYWFGSDGSFFDFYPSQDSSFEVNPPFMIHSTAVEDHLYRILHACETLALSFVLVYPSPHFWDNDVKSHRVYREFQVLEIMLGSGDHWYYRGNQHEQTKADPIAATHQTTVRVLQNEKGRARYDGWISWSFEPELRKAFCTKPGEGT